MPQAKFVSDLLKNVAVHKEQRNRHSDRFGFICDITDLITYLTYLSMDRGLCCGNVHPSAVSVTYLAVVRLVVSILLLWRGR